MFEGKGDTDTKRLPGYSIRVSNDTNIPIIGSICYQDPGNNKLDNILQNDCERTAQYVWIYQNNTILGPCPMLEICEVQVLGMFRCKKKMIRSILSIHYHTCSLETLFVFKIDDFIKVGLSGEHICTCLKYM